MSMKVCASAFYVGLCMAIFLVVSGCSQRPRTRLSSSASVVIKPGAAGPLHSGMTEQQVISEIGEPDKKSDSAFEYSNLGFSVVFKKGVVHSILFVDPAGRDGIIKKAFAGRTKEGIALKASRGDVIRCYGQPDRIDVNPKSPGDEALRYFRPGLTFFIHDGNVNAMAVNL